VSGVGFQCPGCAPLRHVLGRRTLNAIRVWGCSCATNAISPAHMATADSAGLLLLLVPSSADPRAAAAAGGGHASARIGPGEGFRVCCWCYCLCSLCRGLRIPRAAAAVGGGNESAKIGPGEGRLVSSFGLNAGLVYIDANRAPRTAIVGATNAILSSCFPPQEQERYSLPSKHTMRYSSCPFIRSKRATFSCGYA
jgi:hypothetical protein